MDRRRFLTGVAMGSVSVAGCLGAGESLDLPDGMTVETHHRVGSHLIDDGLEPSGERPHSYQTILTDRSAAQERMRDGNRDENEDENETMEFVAETDFDRSYLVVVVARSWSSQHWLEVREIERTEAGIHVSIVTESDDPTVDDAAVHSIAIRITDEEGDEPDVVAVSIDGESMGTAEKAVSRVRTTISSS
ncbi:hypothetical protein [Natronosalvus halobius]|uniref:hypothetical protein n=1 Tax=Natronosalvus halobius TaxID=2953746 RepID=UPI00209F9C33|nr:hypothetical protein [Natronosalvus halobius]USZ72475.1 hypothetical protein NGM15_03940 [Natronosalvus halobius]